MQKKYGSPALGYNNAEDRDPKGAARMKDGRRERSYQKMEDNDVGRTSSTVAKELYIQQRAIQKKEHGRVPQKEQHDPDHSSEQREIKSARRRSWTDREKTKKTVARDATDVAQVERLSRRRLEDDQR